EIQRIEHDIARGQQLQELCAGLGWNKHNPFGDLGHRPAKAFGELVGPVRVLAANKHQAAASVTLEYRLQQAVEVRVDLEQRLRTNIKSRVLWQAQGFATRQRA